MSTTQVDGSDVHVLQTAPIQFDPARPLSPYGINFIPEHNKIVLHRPAPKEKTEGGILLPKSVQAQQARERMQSEESLPFFVLAVSQQTMNNTGIRPGQWVYVDSDTSAQYSTIGSRQVLIADSFNVLGHSLFYEDAEVERLYAPAPVADSTERSL